MASRLDGYLRTRCVELVVHTDDLAASIGLPTHEPDRAAVAVALDVIFEMCRARAGDAEVLRHWPARKGASPTRSGPSNDSRDGPEIRAVGQAQPSSDIERARNATIWSFVHSQ